jgi:type I restriction enzyme S subunit
VLSITQKGIRIKDTESNDGQLSMDYSKYQLVDVGDFAMNHMDLLTGYVDLSPVVGVTSPDYRVFSIRDPNVCYDKFLLYLFQNGYINKVFFPFGQGSSQLGRWRLPTEQFKDFLFPVPNIEEQTQIAAFLDHEIAKIDALVIEQRRLMDLLKEKRQAVISHAVTQGLNPDAPLRASGVEWLGDVPEHWTVKAIKWLSPVLRGASPRPIDDPKYFDDDGEYAWVRIADASASDGVLKETTQRLSALGSSLSVKLQPGTLFVSIAGTVGKPCITGMKACIHDGFVFFPRLKIDQRLLYRVFEAGICYGGLGKMGTQLNLNTDTIGSIRIAVPPAKELREMLDFLDGETARFNELTQEAQLTIDLLQERRTALISAAVTGQIDVRKLAVESTSSADVS